MAPNDGKPKDPVVERRERLAQRLERLGLDPDIVRTAPEGQLECLEALVARAKVSADVRREESMSLEEYRDVVERLGDEYIGTLTSAGLSSLEVRPEQLQPQALDGLGEAIYRNGNRRCETLRGESRWESAAVHLRLA